MIGPECVWEHTSCETDPSHGMTDNLPPNRKDNNRDEWAETNVTTITDHLVPVATDSR